MPYKDKDKANAWARAIRKAHPERSRAYRRAHPERHRAEVLKWSKANPEKVSARTHRRRIRKRGNGGAWTASEWITLKASLGNCCVSCHKTEQELLALGRKLVPDHIRALATGGRNSIDNLQPLCHGIGGCNNRKGARHVDHRGPTPIPYDTLEQSRAHIAIPMEP
jgi:hypothetical protein